MGHDTGQNQQTTAQCPSVIEGESEITQEFNEQGSSEDTSSSCSSGMYINSIYIIHFI